MKALGAYHPAAVAAYFVAVLLGAMFLTDPVLQGLALAGGALYWAVLLGGGAKGLLPYLLTFCLVTVTNPLFSRDGVTVLLAVGEFSVTAESLAYGASLGAAVAGAALWFRCFGEVMTGDRLLALLGRGAPGAALAVSAALRLVPLFRRQAQRTLRAQRALGLGAPEKFTQKVTWAAALLAAVAARSLESAMGAAASMRARGYGRPGRTSFSPVRFWWRDGLLLGLCGLLLGAVLAGSALGLAGYSYYPALSGPGFSPGTAAVYGAYGLLVLLPLLLEGKEALTWNWYRWRM